MTAADPSLRRLSYPLKPRPFSEPSDFYLLPLSAISTSGTGSAGNVLDVGSALGYFLKRVPHDNKLGVDISIEYLRSIRSDGINGMLANAENMPLKDAFDLIVLTDILEHVLHPEKVMESVNKALKVGGRVIVRSPHKEDLSKYSADEGYEYEFGHLRTFDEESLSSLIAGAGLNLRTFHRDGFSFNAARSKKLNRLTGFAVRRLGRLLGKQGWDSSLTLDPWACRLPNWIGLVLFEPYELVAVAEKKGA